MTYMPAIQVASGGFFFFGTCEPKDIDINDIASHISKLCRWTGAVRRFYSVAQHSVIVSQIVPPELAVVGLLHDATEAYLNDLSRPAKQLAPGYVHYEKFALWPVIAERFGLLKVMPHEIHEADNIVLVTEKRDLMPPIPPEYQYLWEWTKDIVPLKEVINPLGPDEAEALFRSRWFQLTGEKI